MFQLPTPERPLRMYNADCLTALRELPSGSFDFVLTDPPYGIGFSSMQRTVDTDGFDKVLNDERPFVWWLYDAARVLKDGGALICFCRYDVAEAFRLAIEWAGLKIKAQLVWDKMIHSMGDLEGAPGFEHEVAWFATKGKYKLPGKRPTTVHRVRRIDGKQMIHPTEKPVALIKKLLEEYTRPGDMVLEPFGGSGVTGMTCYETGRLCFMTELDPDHFARQKKRFAALTDPNKIGTKPPKAAPSGLFSEDSDVG